MNDWHFLPEKDGHHYFLRVTDVYRDDWIIVEYEIYRDEEKDPIEIDFFQQEIDTIIKQVKEFYKDMERTDVC